jgi:thioredoxin-related protein
MNLRLCPFIVFISIIFGLESLSAQPAVNDKIQWLTFEEAVARNAKFPKKKIFVDVYTDWCGWCKKMDNETFVDPAVVAYMKENYYCVKMDAERKDTVVYNGRQFVNPEPGKKRSPHQLAAALLQGRMSYPSYVILDENNQKITSMAGYLKVPDILNILEYYGENNHFKMPWDEFKRHKKQ